MVVGDDVMAFSWTCPQSARLKMGTLINDTVSQAMLCFWGIAETAQNDVVGFHRQECKAHSMLQIRGM